MLQARIALLITVTILMAAMWSSDQTHQTAAAQNLVTVNRVMYRNQIPRHPESESSSYSGTAITHSEVEQQLCTFDSMHESAGSQPSDIPPFFKQHVVSELYLQLTCDAVWLNTPTTLSN